MHEHIRYEDLLAAAQADPEHADYHALRMAYTRADSYAPYAQHNDAVFALRAALQAQNMPEALAACDAMLAFNYLDIEAHMAADYAHTALDNHAESHYHRTFAKGLIDAILTTGTGRDFASALIVIDTAEEYVVLRVLGLAPGRQQLVQHEGHWFDVLDAQASQGDPLKMYFNIDLPYNWLQAQQQDNHDHHDHPAADGGDA